MATSTRSTPKFNPVTLKAQTLEEAIILYTALSEFDETLAKKAMSTFHCECNELTLIKASRNLWNALSDVYKPGYKTI